MTKTCSSMRYIECGSPHISYQLNVNTGGEKSFFEIPLTDDFGKTGLPISLMIPIESVDSLAKLLNIWSISTTKCITSYTSDVLVLRRPATPDTTFHKLDDEPFWRCNVTGECIYHVSSHSDNSYVLRTPDGLEFEFPQLANSSFVNGVYAGNGAKVSIAGNANTGLDYSTGPSGDGRPEFKMHVDFDATNHTISSIAGTRVVNGVTNPMFQVQITWVNYGSNPSFCLITVTRYPFEENGYSVSERYLAKFIEEIGGYWRIDRLSYLSPDNSQILPTNPDDMQVNECVSVSTAGSHVDSRAALGTINYPLSLPIIRTTNCFEGSPITVATQVGNALEHSIFWLTNSSEDFPAGQIECEGDGKGNFIVYSYDVQGRLIEKSDPFYMSAYGSDRRSMLSNGFFASSDWGWQSSGSITMIADDIGEPSQRFGTVCAQLTGSSWIRKGLSKFPNPGDPLLVAAIVKIPNGASISGFSFSVIAYYDNLGPHIIYWQGDYTRLIGKDYCVLVIPVDGHYHLGSFSAKISIDSGTINVKGIQVFGGLSCQEYYYATADSRFPSASSYSGIPVLVDRDSYGNPISVCSDKGGQLLTYLDQVAGKSISLPASQKDEFGFGKQTTYTNLSMLAGTVYYVPDSVLQIGSYTSIYESANYNLFKWNCTSKTNNGTTTSQSESVANKTITETSSPYLVAKQFSTNGDLAKLTFGKTASSQTSECAYTYRIGFLSSAALENSMGYGISRDTLLRINSIYAGSLSGSNVYESRQYGDSGETVYLYPNGGYSEEYSYDYLYSSTEFYETSRAIKVGSSTLWTWQTEYNGYDFVASMTNSTNGIRYENTQSSYRKISQVRYYSNVSYWTCSSSYDASAYGFSGEDVFSRSDGARSYHQGNGLLWVKATKAEGFYSFVPTKTDGGFILTDLDGNTITPTGNYYLMRESAGYGRVYADSSSQVSFQFVGSGPIAACFVAQMPINTNKAIAQIVLGNVSISVLCYNGYLKYKDNQTGITVDIAEIRPGDWESIVVQLDGSLIKIYCSGRIFEFGCTYALNNPTLILNGIPFRAVALKRGTAFTSAKILSLGVMGRDMALPLLIEGFAGVSESSTQLPTNSTQKDGAFHHLGKPLLGSSVMSVFSSDCFIPLGDDYVPSNLKSHGIAYAKNVEFSQALNGFGWRCFGPTVNFSAYGTSTFTVAVKAVPFDVDTSQKRVICALNTSAAPLVLAVQGSKLRLKICNDWVNTGISVSWDALNKIALTYGTTTSGSGYSVTYQLSYMVYCNGQSYSGVTTIPAKNDFGHWIFGGSSFLTEPFYGLIGDVWVCKKELSASQLDTVFGGTNGITKIDYIDALGRIGKSKILYNGLPISQTTINYVPIGACTTRKPSSIGVSAVQTPTTYFGYDSNKQLNEIGGKAFVKDHRGYIVQYGSETLSYDSFGNPTSYSGNGFARSFTYYSTGLPNRLNVVSQGSKSKTFTYTQAYPSAVSVSGFSDLSSLSLTYSGGLLMAASKAGGTASYTYGPDGFLCRSESASGEVSRYAFDSKGRLLSHIMTNRTFNYVYGNDNVPYALVDSSSGVGKCYAIVSDALGRITNIIDPSNGLQAVYSYDLWGVPNLDFDSTTSGVGSLNRLLWKGYLYDKDLGCYCLGKRHYDPFALRFWEPDGLSFLDPSTPGGINPYIYCLNDPITYTDPTGNSAILAAILIGMGSLALTGLGLMIGGRASGNETLMNVGDSIISGAEIVSGIALLATGAGGLFGIGLLGTGVGSFTNGLINTSNGGSYHAGWAGGQLAGGLSFIPYFGGAIGSFLGSAYTDLIDGQYDYNSIDWGKAGASAAISFGLSWLSNGVNWGSSSGLYSLGKASNFVLSYDYALLSISNSILNVWWRGRNKSKR